MINSKRRNKSFYRLNNSFRNETINYYKLSEKTRTAVMRRRLQLIRFKRIMVKAFFAVMICLFLLIKLGNTSLLAENKTAEAQEYKYFKSYEIQKNDSLYSIAAQFNNPRYATNKSYIREVMYINNMNSDRINYGDRIIIPYYSDEKL